ncbi:AAA family ATPase [Microvirga tunisiensis]|uniref:AAA family ATPase n=2 Tax=Microvirga tunisiensis TaxID=2108360 RepID=A0A5N7MR49_9HYPH|nr:AAA family ATPase [Microvirga tunisiensis]MPR10301.1 AAA family ATPase [Microvirga tunisiensis]MPR28929.1 AAA family ATPase [Microvirga tunisiensis]
MSTQSSLDHHSSASVDDVDLEPDDTGGDPASPAPVRHTDLRSMINSAQRHSLRDLLVIPMLKQALGSALVRQLKRGDSTLALVIAVPSPAWVAPLSEALTRLAFQGLMIIGPSERLQRADEAARRAEEAAKALSKGVSVIGIAVTPSQELSKVLLGAADAVVTVPPPDATLANRAIRRFTRKGQAEALSARDLAGLDWPDFVAAFRRGSSRQEIARRLARAAAARSSVSFAENGPPLSALTGYGPALEWAQALVHEIDAMRAGHAPVAVLESALLAGPPGTGKTLLAQALAREAGLPLVTSSVAAWFSASDGHLGAVIREQANFFASLRANRPCVGFLDEIDALPSRLGLGGSRNADFWTPLITGVLLNVDQLRQACPDVIFLAATNHPERVDPALRRPGRLDRVFEIAPPDVAGLTGILRAHLRAELAGADLSSVAQLLLGRVGAAAVQVVHAARRRARLAGRALTLEDLLAEASPPEPRSLAELKACAIHEAGHAVVALALGRTLQGVSLQLAGASGGMTRIEHPGFIPTRSVIEDTVVIGLAGRAADIVLGSGASAGAVGDLAIATRELSALHASFGLGRTLLHRAEAEDASALVRLDGRFAQSIEADLRRLLDRAITIVTKHQSAVLAVAEWLLARRALSGAQVQALLETHSLSAAATYDVPAGAARTDSVDALDSGHEGIILPS